MKRETIISTVAGDVQLTIDAIVESCVMGDHCVFEFTARDQKGSQFIAERFPKLSDAIAHLHSFLMNEYAQSVYAVDAEDEMAFAPL